jgi:hypothetical protein
MGGEDSANQVDGGEAISKSELKRRQKAEKKAAEKVIFLDTNRDILLRSGYLYRYRYILD